MGKRPSHAQRTTLTLHGEKRAKQQNEPAPDTTVRADTTVGPVWKWGAIPYILTLWCVSRVILAIVGVVARTQGVMITRTSMSTDHVWLNIWSAWDASWYYHIADVGYLDAPMDRQYSAWAFFPLYPWTARAVAWVIGAVVDDPVYIAAILVSNAALLIGAWVFYKLVEQDSGGAMARKAVLFLFLFPTGYVLSALMTEGLFFALSVGAWYSARQGNWLVASVLGMASAMTRMVGLVMAPLLALEYLRQRQWHITRIRPNALWIGLVPLGLGVFMATCYTLTGNPWKFVDAQNAWAPQRENPLWVLWWSLEMAWLRGWGTLHYGYLGLGYGAILTIAVTGVLLWGRKQIGTLLVLWSVTLIGISLASHFKSAQSIPRYLAVIFPVFMVLASLRTNSVAFVITVAALILLQGATFTLWTLGWPVAM